MNDLDLIEHLREYYAQEGSKNFNVLDFVGAFGSPLLAIAYSRLFWPDFIELHGMIFISDNVGAGNRKDIDECVNKSWNKQEIEKAFNIFEVPEYFFGKFAGDTYDDEDEHLAEILVQAWRGKLAMDFPNRSFMVEVVDREENGGDLAIWFYQADLPS